VYRGWITKKCDILTTPPYNNHWHYLVKLKMQITWSNDKNDKLQSRTERLMHSDSTGHCSWYIRVMQAYANPSILSSYQEVKTGAMDFHCVSLLSLPTNHEYIGAILCLSTIYIIIIYLCNICYYYVFVLLVLLLLLLLLLCVYDFIYIFIY